MKTNKLSILNEKKNHLAKKVKSSFLHVVMICVSVLLVILGLFCNVVEPIDFVIGIMTVSGAMLAIGFTVYHMIVSDVSKTFPTDMQEIILQQRNPNRVFYLFLLTMIISVLCMTVPESILDYLVLGVGVLFIIALKFFMGSFLNISNVINPIKNIEILHEKILEGLEKDAK